MLPLLILIPLLLVGGIVIWLVLKAILGFVLNVFLWGLGIFFVLIFAYVVYLIIISIKGGSISGAAKSSYSKVKQCVGDACKIVKGGEK